LLGGAKDLNPLNQFYWLEVDTSDIQGAPSKTRWTFYNYCEVQNGRNSNCSKNKADFPFEPDRTFGTTNGVPNDIIENHDVSIFIPKPSVSVCSF
jgi:hypothetical protein